MSWTDPARAWLDLQYDRDFAKYESFPKNAGEQIYKLARDKIALNGDKLSHPVLMVLSEDDETISSSASVRFFNARATDDSNLIVYSKNGQADKPCDPDEKVCTRSSVFSKLNVSSFSHTAIPLSMSNPHYGYNGAHRACTHYLEPDDAEQTKNYNDCLGTDFQWGERNLQGKPVRRLTFNPDFEHMAGLVSGFIERHRP